MLIRRHEEVIGPTSCNGMKGRDMTALNDCNLQSWELYIMCIPHVTRVTNCIRILTKLWSALHS